MKRKKLNNESKRNKTGFEKETKRKKRKKFRNEPKKKKSRAKKRNEKI
jgi:hypothetical protein